MIKPTVPKSFLDQLKLVRSGLHLGWDQIAGKFLIAHEHEYTGQRRPIRYCEDEHGNFRMPDMTDIHYLRKYVDWQKIDKYPDIKEQFNAMVLEKDEAKRAKMKKRNNWIESFVKDNKRGLKEAVRELWSDGYKPYIAPKKDPKIFVETKGYKQTEGGLLVPKFSKGE